MSAERETHFVPGTRFPFTVQGITVLPVGADAPLVWSILTDWSRPGVFSNILQTEVLTPPGHSGPKELRQTCMWNFFTFSGNFDLHLAVDEDKSQWALKFRLLHSSFMRDFEGSWELINLPPTPGGAPGSPASQPRVRVTHVLSVKPLVPVPPPFSYYTRSIFIKQVDQVLQDLEAEVQRQLTARATPHAAASTGAAGAHVDTRERVTAR